MSERCRPRRILVYGFFGMGNVGNEASLEAFLRRLRRYDVPTQVSCLGADPERVSRLYGIPARTLMTGGLHARGVSSRAMCRLLDLPRTWWLVGNADVVVIPGMGVFEGGLGGANPFGLPYWMLVLGIACRLRRRRLLLVSIGVDRVPVALSRILFRWIVRLASYVSVRDRLSADAMHELAPHLDVGPVSADLAFGLDAPEAAVRVPGLVVLGVMRPHPGDRVTTDRYVDRIGAAAAALLQQGDTLCLVIGDEADFAVARQIEDAALRQIGRSYGEHVRISDAVTQTALMVEMAAAEVVVASRYHNLIASLRVGTPTVSLGYADKNDVLLRQFGLSGYDQSIDDIDVDLLLRQIAEARRLSRPPLHEQVLTAMQDTLNDQDRHLRPFLVG